jgi:rhodanese-related sulfurtransferase
MGNMVTLNNAPHNNIQRIQIDEALELLRRHHRIAFIDVRDRKAYVDEHPIFSVNAPIDSIELHIDQLFGDEIGIALVIGDNSRLTDWAAAVIRASTCLIPQIINGGFNAWKHRQLPTWGGEYTPSKAFGEWVETTGEIKNIQPQDAITVPPEYQFDVRPFTEYQKFSLPNSTHCPTGRLGALHIPNGSIYLHCAGRTRGIIAAQTLADQDFKASIYCITGGTQGWELAGGVRSFNNHRSAKSLFSEETMNQHANHLINKFNLPIVTKDCESKWVNSETPFRIITVDEDQLTDRAISPTTLIQSTDQYLGTHNMSIVVQGPNQLDCAVSVLWLRRMGWDAWLREEFAPESVAQGYIGIEPLEWNDEWLRTERIIDIRPSKAFKTSRLKGSTWIPRSHFNSLSMSNRYLIVCDQSQITHIQALVNALNLSKSNCITWDVIPTEYIDSCAISFENHPVDQALFFPDRHRGNLEHAQGYLDWEHSLLPTLRDHGDIPWKPINDPLDQPTSHLTTFYRQVHS